MKPTLYVSLKRHVRLDGRRISFFDVAEVADEPYWRPVLASIVIKEGAGTVSIVTPLDVVEAVQKADASIAVKPVGETACVVRMAQQEAKAPFWKVAFVWIVLFTGAALTIMNFHEDVSMKEVHSLVYEKLTGVKSDKPLWLQIPYAVGLGAGMILFFNRLGRRPLSEEPGPLDVEMGKYEEDINTYFASGGEDGK